MKKTFGDLAEHLMFSESELIRITELLRDKNSLAAKTLHAQLRVLSKNHLNKLVKRYKFLRGYPIHKKSFFDKLYDVCVISLSDKNHRFHIESLKMYRIGVVAYLNESLINLNNLLLNEVYEGEKIDTKLYFTELIKLLPKYDVLMPDVKLFYELWGFPRNEEVESNFPNFVIEGAQVPVHQNIENKDVKNIGESLAKVEKTVNGLETFKNRIHEENKEQDKSISKLNTDLGTVNKLVSGVIKKMNESDDAVDSKIKDKYGQLSKDIKTLSSHVKALLKNQRLDKKNEERLSKIERIIQEIQKNNKTLNEKVDLFKQDINSLLRFKQSLRTTGELKVLPKRKYISEIHFIQRWYSLIQSNSHLNISLDQAVIYHSIFKNSLVTILDDGSLFESWLSALGWLPGNKIIAASPIWTREGDWSDGVDHLQGGTLVNFFPSLTIHNYNCGIPEVSFLPTLLRLSKQKEDVRITLVSRDDETEKVRPEILTIAPYISSEDVRGGLPSGIGSSVEFKKTDTVLNEVIPGENFYEWFNQQSSSSVSDATKTVRTIAEGLGIVLPFDLIDRFYNLYSSLMKYFSDDNSVYLSARYTLFPWIEFELGEAILRTFSENLSSLQNREV